MIQLNIDKSIEEVIMVQEDDHNNQQRHVANESMTMIGGIIMKEKIKEKATEAAAVIEACEEVIEECEEATEVAEEEVKEACEEVTEAVAVVEAEEADTVQTEIETTSNLNSTMKPHLLLNQQCIVVVVEA